MSDTSVVIREFVVGDEQGVVELIVRCTAETTGRPLPSGFAELSTAPAFSEKLVLASAVDWAAALPAPNVSVAHPTAATKPRVKNLFN